MKPLVIYHDNCADGFGAAFAAWLKLGDEAEYLPMQYGNEQDPGSFIGREIYILDFSFDRPTMEMFFRTAKRVVWLDHHKTAFEMWGKGLPWFKDADYQDKHYIDLNDRKSGALLAWEYFHPGTEVPLLIQHIDDRDRWQFKLEGSKEIHAALVSHKPWSFKTWKGIWFQPDYEHEAISYSYHEGKAILRAQDAIVKSLAQKAQPCKIWQHCGDHYDERNSLEVEGLAVNSPIYQSEIGHELANTSGTFGLVWFWNAEEHEVNCSLRSNGDYDVSAIAKAFGGGGHKNAAGFSCSMDQLMGWLR